MKEYNWHEERKKYQADIASRQETPTPAPAEPAPAPSGSSWGKILLTVVILAAIGAAGYFFLQKKDAPAPEAGAAPQGNFVSVVEKIQNGVGVVCLRVEILDGQHVDEPVGTAWAMDTHKYATNAHVAKALPEKEYEFLKMLASEAISKDYQVSTSQEFRKKLAEEIVREQLTDDATIQQLMVQNQVSTQDALLNMLVNIRVSELEKVYTASMAQKAKFSVLIYPNKMPGKALTVTHVQIHPLYKDPYSPDVAVLTVDGNAPCVLPIASAEKLNTLKQGQKIAFLGFPMEGLTNGNLNLDSPIATFQEGEIVAISDFDLKDTKPEYAYCIRHNLPNPGGSSGSPIFNLDGEVIALNNCGAVASVLQADGSASRIDSAGMVNGAIRVDLLEGVGAPVTIQEWLTLSPQ